MKILNEIVAHKRQEVAEQKELYPVKLLEKSIYFNTPVVSLCKYLRRADKVGIIGEIKRRSPGKGVINAYIDVEQLSIGYMQAGASAISVLTDSKYFGGSNDDLTVARKYNFCPILRKDFILEEYQIVEAKSIGADAVLLIAMVLNTDEVFTLARFAHAMGMEVLLEVHSQEELTAYPNEHIDLISVNNRNLSNMSLDVNTCMKLIDHIPQDFVAVSASGLGNPVLVSELRKAGYKGFLIGTHFMSHSQPHKACADFIRDVQAIQKSEISSNGKSPES